MVDYFPIQKTGYLRKFSNFLNNYSISLLTLATFILSYVNYDQTMSYNKRESEKRKQEIEDHNIEYFRERLDFAIKVQYWLNNGNVYNVQISKKESEKISLEQYSQYAPFSDNIAQDHLFFSLYKIFKSYPHRMSIYDSLILSNLSATTRPKEAHALRLHAYRQAIVSGNENPLASASAKLYYAHDVHFGDIYRKPNPNQASLITENAANAIDYSGNYQMNGLKLQLLFAQSSNMGSINNKSQCLRFADLALKDMQYMLLNRQPFPNKYKNAIPKLIENCNKLS